MPAPNAISNDKLARLIGTARAPLLLDVRSDADYQADPRMIPGAVRAPPPRRWLALRSPRARDTTCRGQRRRPGPAGRRRPMR